MSRDSLKPHMLKKNRAEDVLFNEGEAEDCAVETGERNNVSDFYFKNLIAFCQGVMNFGTDSVMCSPGVFL